MVCKPTGTTWSCVWGDGATETVTAGTSPTNYTDPMGRNALDTLTNAKLPIINSASARLLAAFNGPHTVITVGQANNVAEGLAGVEPYWRWTSTGGTGEYQRGENDANTASGTNVSTVSAGGLIHGWGLAGHSISALAGTVINNQDETNSNSAAVNITGGTGGVMRFMQDCVPACATGDIASGSISALILYSTAKTAAEMNIMRYNAFALADDAANPVRIIRDARGWAPPWLTGNRAEPFTRGTPIVTSRGLEIHPGSEGARPAGTGWVLDNATTGGAHSGLNATTWTDTVSPPTVNQNVAAGYFGAWATNNTAGLEMDEIVDDNAAGDEGKTGALNCGDSAAAGSYSVGIVARTGTTGVTTDKMRLAISTDGTVGSPCTTWQRVRDGASVTTLTATPEFYRCDFAVTGAPTFVRGQVLVGNTAAQTGSIIVEAPTCTALVNGGVPIPLPDSVTTNPDIAWINFAEVHSWPSGASSTVNIEIVFTLDYDMPGSPTNAGEYLINTSDGATAEHKLLMFQTGTSDGHAATDVFVRSGWRSAAYAGTCPGGAFGNSGTDITSSGTLGSFTAGTQLVARLKIVPAGTTAGVPRVDQFIFFDTCPNASTCHATTLRASNTSHTMCAGDTSDTYGILGGRASGASPASTISEMNGAIARFTVTETRS